MGRSGADCSSGCASSSSGEDDSTRRQELVQVIDQPEGVRRAIFKHYEHRSFQPRAASAILLNL